MNKPSKPGEIYLALESRFGNELTPTQLWELKEKVESVVANMLTDPSRDIGFVQYDSAGDPVMIETIGLELIEEVKAIKK